MALPRWTWRRFAVELACTLVVAALCHGHGAAPVSFAFWGVFFGILSGIWNAFKTGVEVAATAIVAALQWLKARVFDLGRLFGSSLAFLGNGLKDFASGVTNFIAYGAIPVFQQLFNWAKSGVDLFQKAVGSVVNVVTTIRGWISGFYNEFVKPVTDAIDFTKRALGVLASLGIDGAAALAAKLSLVEQKIQQPFQDIIGKLNEVIGVLNRVMTLDGLIQKLTLFASLFGYRKEFSNFTINALFAVKPGTTTPTTEPQTPAQALDQEIVDVTRLAESGGTDLTPFQQEWVDDLMAKIQRAA